MSNRTSIRAGQLLVWTTMLCSMSAGAQDYSSGHHALQVWDSAAMAGLPVWVKLWLVFMGSIFACGVFFVKRHIEARWLVGGFALGLLLTKFVVPLLGLVPLSGLVALVHIVFWSPALYLFLKNRPFLGKFSAYGLWSGVATGCILFSFVFDIRDAYIYLAEAAFVTA